MSIFSGSISAALSQGKKIIFQNFLKLLAMAVLLFGIIWIGYVIRVVGSREICDNVTVTLQAAGQNQLASHPLIRLAHAGNTSQLKPDGNIKNRWTTEDVFIDKIFLVLNKDEQPAIKSGQITIGDKVFPFTAQDLTKWAALTPQETSVYVAYDQSSQALLQLPSDIRSANSHLPFFHKVFGNTINWAGDSKLLVDPLVSALKLFALIAAAVLLYFFLLLSMRLGSEPQPDRAEEQSQRINFLAFSITLFLSAAGLFLLNLLIRFAYKPDISAILEQARAVYLPSMMPSFVPKPVEHMQYVLSVVTAPLLLLYFYRLAVSYLNKKSEAAIIKLSNFFVPFSILSLLALVFWGLAMSNFLYVQNSYFVNPLGKYVYAILLFPLLLWLTFAQNKYVKKLLDFLPFIFITAIALAAFFLNIFSFSNIPLGPYNFDPIFYPLAQLMGEKTLLVGFGSVYGLYPIFLNVIFRIFGLSVFKITLVIAGLFSLSYVALFVFLKNTIRHKLILLSGISAVFFFSYYNITEIYFQYWPIRFFPACVLILLVSLFIKKDKKVYYYLGFAWSCISLLWNFETGLILLLSWMLILAYCDFAEIKGIGLVKKFGRDLIWLAGFLAATVIIFTVYTFLRSGAFPNPELFYKYQKLYLSGYFMIPMLPPPHTWSIIVFTYLAGLLYSIKLLFTSPNKKGKIVFFLSVLGLGLFSYYEGRSHDLTLVGPSFVAVLLFTIFSDELLDFVEKNGPTFGATAVLIILLFFLYAAPVSLITNASQITRSIIGNINSLKASDPLISKNINFIKQNTKAKEKIYILSNNYDGVYYLESGTICALDLPSTTDYSTKQEAAYAVNFLKQNSDTKIFVDSNNPVVVWDGSGIDTVLKNDYRTVQTSGEGLALLVKK